MKKLLLTSILVLTPLVFSEDVNLSWTDNSDNEVGFEVERKEPGGEFTQIGSVAENVSTYLDKTAELGKVYVYRVRAFNYAGKSGFTNEASIEVKPDKYFRPFEPGGDPSSLESQQVIASLTINAKNVTVNQIASNDIP